MDHESQPLNPPECPSVPPTSLPPDPNSNPTLTAPVSPINQQQNQQTPGPVKSFPITYSRRKNTHKYDNPEISTQPASNPNIGTVTDLNELDIPIALRKGSRACTKHPISNFLGYSHLSQSMQALVTQLSDIEIPKTIEETL